jgi:hypothetical protein
MLHTIPRRCLSNTTSRSSPLVKSLASRPPTYSHPISRSTTLLQSTRPYTSFSRSSSSYVSSPTLLELSSLPLLRRSYASPPSSDSAPSSADAAKTSQHAELLAKEMSAPPAVKEDGSKEVGKPKLTWPEYIRAFPSIAMKEIKHYWHGFKLLGKETKISWKLLRKLTRGDNLTRREQRQVSFNPQPLPSSPLPSTLLSCLIASWLTISSLLPSSS